MTKIEDEVFKMFELGKLGELISIFFAGTGIYMAHALYKSPRKPWQCILAWTVIILSCTMLGEFLNVMLPQYTEQRIAIFTGCSFVLAYIYLFPNIPLQQRIFTYFMVDNCMYLIVLFARTLSMMLVNYFGLPAMETMFVVYMMTIGLFSTFFSKYLKTALLRGLEMFQKNLESLSIFAVVCYFSTIILIDIWKPWPSLTIFDALPYLAIIAANLAGYGLAFRTLNVIGERMKAESSAAVVGLQLSLAEKEYNTTIENIDQVRRLKHDMIHHLNAIDALIAKDDKEAALDYIKNVSQLLPSTVIGNDNVVTGGIIQRYKEMCLNEDIKFSYDISYSEKSFANKTHLGIILGNALQNAYEAASKITNSSKFISIEGKSKRDNLIIIVKNSYEGNINKGLRTTKGENHGLGLENMRRIAEQYNGFLDTSWDEKTFNLRVILTLSS